MNSKDFSGSKTKIFVGSFFPFMINDPLKERILLVDSGTASTRVMMLVESCLFLKTKAGGDAPHLPWQGLWCGGQGMDVLCGKGWEVCVNMFQ